MGRTTTVDGLCLSSRNLIPFKSLKHTNYPSILSKIYQNMVLLSERKLSLHYFNCVSIVTPKQSSFLNFTGLLSNSRSSVYTRSYTGSLTNSRRLLIVSTSLLTLSDDYYSLRINVGRWIHSSGLAYGSHTQTFQSHTTATP